MLTSNFIVQAPCAHFEVENDSYEPRRKEGEYKIYLVYFEYVVSSNTHAQEAIIFLAICFCNLFSKFTDTKAIVDLFANYLLQHLLFSKQDQSTHSSVMSGTYQLNEDFHDHFLFQVQESKRS